MMDLPRLPDEQTRPPSVPDTDFSSMTFCESLEMLTDEYAMSVPWRTCFSMAPSGSALATAGHSWSNEALWQQSQHGAVVMRIFLAGATGAIGKRLVPLLINAGHQVTGMTRSATRGAALRAAGAEPAVVDVLDLETLSRAVSAAHPDIVVHQLTDLPPGLDPSKMAEATQKNARIRRQGTRNLITTALAAGVPRVVAQSIAWVYAPGPEPHPETDPLDLDSSGPRSITVAAVAALELLTVSSPPIDGIVLRYGHFYGPGTGADAAAPAPAVHVDAAASAALLAIEKEGRGIYNIAEPSAYLSTEKAQRELAFDASFRFA